MSKKQQLIDFVLGNDFIVKPSLRNQFELMLNDAICESSSNWISVNERLPEIDTADEWNKQATKERGRNFHFCFANNGRTTN